MTDTAGPRRFLGAPGVRALVVGTATHQRGSVLPDLPTVAATAYDLGAALVSRCGLAADQVRVAVDPDTPAEFARLLHECAEEASDVLVVAYLGHGLVGPAGELYLAVGATIQLGTGLSYQALSFDVVRTIVRDCRARSVVVLLDCCFAGRADGPIGDVTGGGFAAAQVRGSYLLAAAAANETAMASIDEPHTAFTGALIDLLTDGDPAGPPVLTLDHAFHYIERTLSARQLSRPRRHVMDSSGDIVLAPNPAYATPDVPTPPAPDADAACPYPGLSAYRPEDSGYFFGREALTAQLAERVASHAWRHGPLMVLGASGAGKSSVLGAGLVPALHDGRVPLAGSWSWRAMLTTPGAHPMDMLAARIDSATAGLLIVDQFEELFTECADPAERAAFVSALCDLCRPAPDDELPRVLVVLAMRADYYQECTRLPELVAALEQGPVVVGPMNAQQVRAAIEGPAAAAGLVLEAGLADRLVYDLGEPAGSLPLLSHALLSTWLARSGRVLTLAGYQASGGIADAVARTAERVYDDLDDDGRRVARRVLQSLVRIGDSAQDTRGRVPLADVIGNSVVAQRVVTALVRARLVRVGADSVEIAHEALLRAWPRLRTWIDEDRTWLLARQSLGAAAQAWVREQRDPSGLYQGPRLAAARAVLADRITELSDVEREFLDASIWQADADHRARRRRTLVLRGLSVSLVLLLLAVVGVLVVAVQTGNNRAQLARDKASQQLAALSADSLTAVSSDPYNADLRALAAWRAAPTAEARSALLSAGITSYEGLLPDSGSDPAVALAASDDGRFIAAGDYDCMGNQKKPVCGTLRIWDTATRHEVVDQTYSGAVSSLAFTPDGHTLVVGAIVPEFQAQSWDMRTLRPTATFGVAGSIAVAVSLDGGTVAVARPDGVTLWHVATRTSTTTLSTGGSLPRSLTFSPDGRLLVAGVNDNTVRVWNTATHRQIAMLTGHSKAVRAVAFSPDGNTLASASQDSTVRLWSTVDFAPIAVLRPLAGTRDSFDTVAFSSDGSAVLAAGTNTQIVIWETTTGTLFNAAAYNGSNFVAAIAVVPGMIVSSYSDGDVLVQGAAIGVPFSSQPVYGAAVDYRHGLAATSDQAGKINLWNYRTGRPITVLRSGSSVPDVAFAPDGASLAASSKGRVTVWDLATRRPVHTLPLPDTRSDAGDVRYSPDGAFLVSQSTGTLDFATTLDVRLSVDVWDTRTWRLVLTVQGPSLTQPTDFAVAPTGAEIAVTNGSDIQLWDLVTRHRTATWSTHGESAAKLAFVPGGHLLLAANHDGTVSEWDTVSHVKVRGFLGAPSEVHALGVSPDGSMFAIGGQDPVINIRSLTDGDLVATLRGDTQRVNKLVFNQDDTKLLSTANDGTAIWWDLVPDRVVHTLCRAVRGPRLATAWRALADDAHVDIGAPPC
jgi:WD40 repeat protein